MKKTSIYLLSLIIIFVVTFSVLQPTYDIAKTFIAGFNQGYNETSGESQSYFDNMESGSPIEVKFTPEIATMMQPSDSIVFDNGKTLPLVINSAAVVLPDKTVPDWYYFLNLFCYPMQVILLIVLIWRFLKFIINISKERIFVKQNVKLLNQFSIILLAIAFLEIVANLMHTRLFSSYSFTMAGYELSAFVSFPWSNILLGCTGLLMAEVWDRGLKIEEEQKLTI